MSKHAKPKSNFQKFMESQFMYLVSYTFLAVMIGYTFASV